MPIISLVQSLCPHRDMAQRREVIDVRFWMTLEGLSIVDHLKLLQLHNPTNA